MYVYNSFREITRVIDNSVIPTDGFSFLSIINKVSSAISPSGAFPTTELDCYYSATCQGSVDVSSTLGVSAEVGVKKLADAGFSVEGQAGTTIYFTKTVSSSWAISVWG